MPLSTKRSFTLEAVVRVLGITAYLFWAQWQLGAIAVVLVPVLSFASKVYGAAAIAAAAHIATHPRAAFAILKDGAVIGSPGGFRRENHGRQRSKGPKRLCEGKRGAQNDCRCNRTSLSRMAGGPSALPASPAPLAAADVARAGFSLARFGAPQVAQDAICSIRTVVSFAGEAFEKRRYACAPALLSFFASHGGLSAP